MFGPKQNYSSKHLDRTSTCPVLEQLHRLNSIYYSSELCSVQALSWLHSPAYLEGEV